MFIWMTESFPWWKFMEVLKGADNTGFGGACPMIWRGLESRSQLADI